MLARAHRPLTWDRAAVLVGVIALHVGGIALVSVYGGFTTWVEKTAGALTLVQLTPEPPRTRPEPAPPPVVLQPADRFEARVPDPLTFDPEVGERPGALTVIAGDDRTPNDGGDVAPQPIAPTALSYRTRRSTDDFYPPVSIRMAEEGAAVVRVCVGPAGELQGAPQVQRSSGHARLDAAAIAWAREALTFIPAAENGVPVASCKGFRVRFALK